MPESSEGDAVGLPLLFKIVVCYCHYCLEGLHAGAVNGKRVANL